MRALIREYYTLKDGTKLPKISFGCCHHGKQNFIEAIRTAIKLGYKYFDTASLYETERDLAKALKELRVPRKDVQIASKAWYDELGYKETKAAFERSINRLETNYLDFYFLHWPIPCSHPSNWKEIDSESWRALIELKSEGKILHLATSNFLPHHLENLKKSSGVLPEINQLELHIGYSQELACLYCKEKGILLQAWSPLARGKANNNPLICEMAKKYGVSLAKLSLRFLLQKGIMPLPMATSNEHIKNNVDVFDFDISEEDMWILSCMPQSAWLGEHPDFFVPNKSVNIDQ